MLLAAIDNRYITWYGVGNGWKTCISGGYHRRHGDRGW